MAPAGQVKQGEGVVGGTESRQTGERAARALWGAVRDLMRREPEVQGTEL